MPRVSCDCPDLRPTTKGPDSWHPQAMGGHKGIPVGSKNCLLLPPQEGMPTGLGSIAMDLRSRTGPHGQGDR